jgi:3-methyladenine DNA glycosylase AlkD
VVTIGRRASELLTAAADPAKAGPMAAYMKSDTPFYGVGAKERKTVVAQLVSEFPVASRKEYTSRVRSLWAGSFREDRYVAIGYARSFAQFATISSVPLYRTMIVRGSWWGYVDEIAIHLVGSVLIVQSEAATPRIGAWISDRQL